MRNKIAKKIAWLLPPSVAMWAFIRIYSLSGDGPGKDFRNAYDLAKKKFNLKDF